LLGRGASWWLVSWVEGPPTGGAIEEADLDLGGGGARPLLPYRAYAESGSMGADEPGGRVGGGGGGHLTCQRRMASLPVPATRRRIGQGHGPGPKINDGRRRR
jgi:hypothetical protein